MSFSSFCSRIFVLLISYVAACSAFVRAPFRRFSSSSMQMMKELPKDVVKYSQVPAKGGAFTANKIPKGLLREHTTKAGTWGVINVSQGQLRYKINEPAESVHILDVDTKGIIEPTVKHEVAALTDDVEFFVEFYRLPNTGPVDEKRD